MARRKLVSVATQGPIPELRGIGGPILHPQNITIDAVRLMVTHGKKVFEHNPANPDEKIRLTVDNVESDNFKKKAAPAETAEKAPYLGLAERETRELSDSIRLSDEITKTETPEEKFPGTDKTPVEDRNVEDTAEKEKIIVPEEEAPVAIVVADAAKPVATQANNSKNNDGGKHKSKH